MNVHDQAKATPKLIANYLQDNTTRQYQSMTQHKYLTKIANAIIDDGTGKELRYLQLSKHPQKIKNGNNPSPTNLEN